jgi:hypothetical protein
MLLAIACLLSSLIECLDSLYIISRTGLLAYLADKCVGWEMF